MEKNIKLNVQLQRDLNIERKDARDVAMTLSGI